MNKYKASQFCFDHAPDNVADNETFHPGKANMFEAQLFEAERVIEKVCSCSTSAQNGLKSSAASKAGGF